MIEELTLCEMETIELLQKGLGIQVIEIPIPDLIKKGYVEPKSAGRAILTLKEKIFKRIT